MNFDRIRVRMRRASGSTWEVVKETHTAGQWEGSPSEVEVLEKGLTREKAAALVKKERGAPPRKSNPYGGYS